MSTGPRLASPCHRAGALPCQLTSLLPTPYLAPDTSSGPCPYSPMLQSWSPAFPADQPPPRSLPCLAESGTSSGPSLHPPYHRSGALPCQLTSLPPIRSFPSPRHVIRAKPPPALAIAPEPCLASCTASSPLLTYPATLDPCSPLRATALEPCLASRSASSPLPTQPHTRPTDSDFSA